MPKSQVKMTKSQGDVAHDIRVNTYIKFVVMCSCLFAALYGCYMCLISVETNRLKALKIVKNKQHTPISSI